MLEGYNKVCPRCGKDDNYIGSKVCVGCGAFLLYEDYITENKGVLDSESEELSVDGSKEYQRASKQLQIIKKWSLLLKSMERTDDSEDFQIQRHSFEDAKNEIRKFAANAPSEIELSKFETNGGLFWLFNHNVTGREMNEYTQKLQDLLIALNERDTEIINQFHEVYNAFEALDKDYIQSILISVKAAEKAGLDAQKAQKDANHTIEGLEKAQNDIKNTMKALQATILKLQQFRSEIDSVKHIKDVDELWNRVANVQKQMELFNNESLVENHRILIEKLRSDLRKLQEQDEEKSRKYSKKLKFSYILSGCGLGVALLELIFLIVRSM